MPIRLAFRWLTRLFRPQMQPQVLTLRIAWKRLSISALFRMQDAGMESPSYTSYTSNISKIYLISIAISTCTSTKIDNFSSHSYWSIASLSNSKPLPFVELGSLVVCFAQQVCLQQQMSSPMHTSLLKVVQSIDRNMRKASFNPLRLLLPFLISELLETRCMIPANASNFLPSSRYLSNNFSISISKAPQISANTRQSDVRQAVQTY